MTAITITCVRCGLRATGTTYSQSGMCRPCKREHNVERLLAAKELHRAIRHREFPPAKTLQCVDCDARAHDYDHRDYTRPLAVQPTCRSCNLKRGSAFDSKYRPSDVGAVHDREFVPVGLATPRNSFSEVCGL